MSAYKTFKLKFSSKHIRFVYFDKIKHNCSPGIDRINRKIFENKLKEHINIISRKVISGTYRFSSYKEKLLLKDRNKLPRIISIPTIRDKITLKIVQEILTESFKNDITQRLVHSYINDMNTAIIYNNYDAYIRIDIKDFFPSIKHEILMRKLRKKIRKKEILDLINLAIKTPTISGNKGDKNTKIHVGIPQGISISNILSSIYMSDLDKKYININNCTYIRYVDDILILCKSGDTAKIKKQIIDDIQKDLELEVNEHKTKEGKICDGFTFLGYTRNNNIITVNENSLYKFQNSLTKLFAEFRHSNHQNESLFLWKLNLKITGCISQKNKYGWLFFFSQINDKTLLFQLDWLVTKLSKQYNIDKKILDFNLKKFMRTYHEITLNLSNTKYIPNFDDYTIEDKLHVINNIFKYKFTNFSDEQIEDKFKEIVVKSIKDLEKDIQSIS